MAYVCYVCGKGKQFGHNVSFSQRKTNKVFRPNLHAKTIQVDGTSLQVKICSQCLRTMAKRQVAASAKE